MCLSYAHNPESTRKIFTDLTLRDLSSWKTSLDSSVMKKTVAELKTKGKKLNPHMTCTVNSCQEKLTGVLF